MCRVKVLQTSQKSLTRIEPADKTSSMSLCQIQFTLDWVRRYADSKDIAWDTAFSELKKNKGLDYLVAVSRQKEVSTRKILLELKKY